jgi:hypothetical protein
MLEPLARATSKAKHLLASLHSQGLSLRFLAQFGTQSAFRALDRHDAQFPFSHFEAHNDRGRSGPFGESWAISLTVHSRLAGVGSHLGRVAVWAYRLHTAQPDLEIAVPGCLSSVRRSTDPNWPEVRLGHWRPRCSRPRQVSASPAQPRAGVQSPATAARSRADLRADVSATRPVR